MIQTLTEKQIYRFQDIEVDISRGCLRRGDREEHLRQKAFQVLVYLIERRERLVTKDELIEVVWKDTAVTDDVLVQCIKEIRRVLSDSPQQPRFIKTVPKAGYRFIGSVEESFPLIPTIVQTEEITRVEIEFEEDSDSPPLVSEMPKFIPARKHRFEFNPRTAFSGAAILILLVASSLWLYFKPGFNASEAAEIRLPQVPGKKAVAVMFFENQSGNAELDWLREGLADMLIADLSRSEKLIVLSRGQLHLLLGRNRKEENAKIEFDKAIEIARKTQAESIVTGNFVKLGEKIRLDVQLHDAKTGVLTTSETLVVERPEQILSEIDFLSLKLLMRLNALPEAQQNPVLLAQTMTDNLEAYRYYSIGVEKAQALHNQEAISLFEKAVALDPQFALAHARIGYTYAVAWGRVNEGKPHLEKAFKLSSRLTEKDRLNISAWYAIANLDFPNAIRQYREIINQYPLETEAYCRLGRLLAGEGQLEEAVNVLRKGVAIDSEAKDIYNTLGGLLSELNRHEEAISARRRYVALAPEEPNAYDSLGLAYQWQGDYKQAIENYERALELNPKFEIALIHLANVRAQIGQYSEAINLFDKYVQIAPSESERVRGYDNLAAVYLKKGDLDQAEKYARETLKHRKDVVWHSFVLARLRGDLKRANDLERQIFDRVPSTDRGARQKRRFESYQRGYIAFINGKADEAIAHFKEAVSLPAPIWHIDSFEDCLAKAYLELDRLDEAIAEYDRILQLNPNYPLARFHLAQAFERKGLAEKATQNYRLFLQIWSQADENIPELNHAKNFISQN
ncbi:MAG: tetratricopeptide repeat protein [Acidobacteriota bacterium]|nr:tetratricopeptide repeat protein [Acidobacteriota bacterium]